jgi:hypothetical protein
MIGFDAVVAVLLGHLRCRRDQCRHAVKAPKQRTSGPLALGSAARSRCRRRVAMSAMVDRRFFVPAL